MRSSIVVIFVLVAVGCVAGGCKTRPRAESAPDAAAEPNRNPYRNVMPDKIKKQVEDTQKKEDERGDKVLENAK
jgi:hypothetical protein